jgi:hypothetical protein
VRALLDINVLLALLDADHVDHSTARAWLSAEIETGWSSCALTQNGFVRIISQPRYPNPVPVAELFGDWAEPRPPSTMSSGPAMPASSTQR